LKVLSYLMVFSFFVSHLASAYTIALKSGKFLDGELLGEDGFTIQLKDRSGILLSIKKEFVDLEVTKRKNAPKEPEKPVPIIQTSPKTIVQIAEENRQKRNHAKAYTTKDLSGLPELSVIGSEEADSSEIRLSDPEIEVPSRAEQYWRKEALGLKKRLESLSEKIAGVEEACNQARQTSATSRAKPHKKVVDMLSMMEEPSVCKKYEELLRQLEETQNRWEDFELRARRAGVPWSWLEQ
jgi:hypothetical protein